MSKKITSILMIFCMLISFVLSGNISNAATINIDSTMASIEPQGTIQGSAVLHCFNWSYNAIKRNLSAIKEAGYTAVQTSPVHTPKDYGASWTVQSEQWWKLYQPIDINVADGNNWLGTKAELKALCDEADTLGIKVICDVVFNHMANVSGSGGNQMSNISPQVNSTLRNNSAYWHINSLWANNDNDRYSMTMGSIGMPDLNTSRSYIQQRCKNVLIELIGLGVDGFRFDAAKHIETPTDSTNPSQFWPTVINGSQDSTENDIYYYGELLNGFATTASAYTKYMSVTDNYSSDCALAAACNNNASGLANYYYSKQAGADKSVLWVESHDTYMGSSGSAGISNTASVSNDKIIKAWAIVGSRQDATSLFFARPANSMGSASIDTTWKSPEVAEVNKFKNYFDGQSEYLASSGKVAYNERGTTGVVISKLDGGGSVSLTAHKMADGTYKDQITGNTFTVANDKITGTVGSTGVAVVYNLNPTGNSEALLIGDANLNGEISVIDATAIQKYIAKMITLNDDAMLTSDVDKDGKINIKDATKIQKYLAKFTDNIGSCGEYFLPEKPTTEPTTEATTEPTTEATYTITFSNSLTWGGSIYCYYWTNNMDAFTTWPGEKMTKAGKNVYGETQYTIDIPNTAENIVISNGTLQTVDIPITGDINLYALTTQDDQGHYYVGTE